MNNFINLDKLSLNEEVLRHGDWITEDVLSFQRKIIVEALIDKLDWLINSHKGTEAYVTQTRERVMQAQRRFTGDEISTMFLKGAIAEAKAASLKNEVLNDMLNQLSTGYATEHGKEYTPYGRMKMSNVRSDTNSDIPADIAKELAALGITPDIATVSNTNGVDDTRDIA
jgi:hypothetical protein